MQRRLPKPFLFWRSPKSHNRGENFHTQNDVAARLDIYGNHIPTGMMFSPQPLLHLRLGTPFRSLQEPLAARNMIQNALPHDLSEAQGSVQKNLKHHRAPPAFGSVTGQVKASGLARVNSLGLESGQGRTLKLFVQRLFLPPFTACRISSGKARQTPQADATAFEVWG